MGFEKTDLNYYRAFKAIVMKAKFETHGDALTQVGALSQWFISLEKKIEDAISDEKKTIRKDLK